jgi:phosphotransferase system  glucose/maltose/N-acetylglucosamine-specific IIC component
MCELGVVSCMFLLAVHVLWFVYCILCILLGWGLDLVRVDHGVIFIGDICIWSYNEC